MVIKNISYYFFLVVCRETEKKVEQWNRPRRSLVAAGFLPCSTTAGQVEQTWNKSGTDLVNEVH